MRDRTIKSRRRFVKAINEMPGSLKFAEIFIAILCISYVLKISGLAMDIAKSESLSITNVVLLEMDVVFLGITLFAALGIYSHKPESWRKVVRSCITFVIATIISAVYTNDSSSHVFDFNPIVTFVALVALLIIMVASKRVKEFYTPPMMKVPRTLQWLRFALFGKLIDSKYSIVFEDTKLNKRNKVVPDPEFPNELEPIISEIANNHNL